MLERIKAQGTLRVATVNSATTLYEGAESLAGFEYELVSKFAASLGLPVEFVLYSSKEALYSAVQTGQVHMVAAGLTLAQERAHHLKFSVPYQEIEQHLMYRRGNRRPKTLDELEGSLLIPAGSSYQYKLSELQRTLHPELTWAQAQDTCNDDILSLLNEGSIDYAIADSNTINLIRAYYPHTKPAFVLPGKEELAWGFSHVFDDSLLQAADNFLTQQASNGELKKLQTKYYSNISSMSFVDNRNFWRHVENRLPKYEILFKKVAEAVDMDWRLLAAISYQESHWKKSAVSPTGVRGIMMLTLNTAELQGVTNRSDPAQSIMGGANHLIWSSNRIPERIKGKDRLWFALASYNIGYGHLEDARVLTQRMGGNPDKWKHVKQRLPLLAQKKYYKNLKHGYARGREPVTYVENIQHYYRLLIWYSNRDDSQSPSS